MRNSRERIGLRISPESKRELRQMAQSLGTTPSDLVDRLIRNYRRGRYTKDRNCYRVRLARALQLISEP